MKIPLNEYQEIALERLNPSIVNNKKESMKYCCMGLLEESGEIAAEIRKPLFKGNYHEKLLNKEAITSELGDIIWYMALVCKNNNIDITNLEKEMDLNEGNEKREKLINQSIKIGRTSGKIVHRYFEFSKGKMKKEKLEEVLKKQYKNIVKLANELNITIDEILQINLEKVNSRYKENGEAKSIGE